MIARAFGSAFGLTFVAELGDKTQLAILTLSARYGFLPVFAGAVVAFAVLDALAVTVGFVVARFVPEIVIRIAAGSVFVVFGVLAFRPESEEEEEAAERKARNPFVTALLVVALMELGDKTQLALVALTSRFQGAGAALSIWLGGTLALACTSLIAALVGKGLAKVIPLKYIRWASGVVFIVFGFLIATGVF